MLSVVKGSKSATGVSPLLGSAEDALDQGEESGDAFLPGAEQGHAVAAEAAAGGVEIGRGGFGALLKLVEDGGAAVDVGAEPLGKEAVEQDADFYLGIKVVATVAGDVNGLERAEIAQGAQALAGGALAHAEAVADFGEVDGAIRDVGEAVDLAEGAGKAEHVGDGNEDGDDLALAVIENGRGGACRGSVGKVGHGLELLDLVAPTSRGALGRGGFFNR